MVKDKAGREKKVVAKTKQDEKVVVDVNDPTLARYYDEVTGELIVVQGDSIPATPLYTGHTE